MLRKVLIANRGEIAVRVARACRELGVGAVAVYSDADAGARHVFACDEAVRLGPPPARESYLNVAALIGAAKATGCDAVHPGYGFLSESAAFAEAVTEAGLVWVGPPPGAIRSMGQKTEARAAMEAAGVPVVPGQRDGGDLSEFVRSARALGYPVLVKALAGGGGKGMRLVRSEGEIAEALDSARHEAGASFGDPRVYLEKYLEGAHHVEVQVLADGEGRTIHLFERECSVQRRHQKVIEESPSPLLDDGLRRRMGETAVAAARAVGYASAGTVEFLVDAHRNYYFLEMNTRLQVEHPVTELVTGVDLVQAQLRIAAGERLWLRQEDLCQRGHAIECRIYAEDPAQGHLPATGTLLSVEEPWAPGVRVDSGVEAGSVVTHHYDPLLAKVVACAEDRAGALDRMEAALSRYVLLGIPTNVRFLEDVLRHETFRSGTATTGFLDEHFADWSPPLEPVPDLVFIAAAVGATAAPASGPAAAPALHDPWRAADGFRLGGR